MSDDQSVYYYSFPAMGSEVELLLVGPSEESPDAARELAEQLAGDWERIFSRFRPESELSRLNQCAGEPVPVSERLFAALELAVLGARWTRGLYDPTILPALKRAGYDRTFERIGAPAAASAIPAQVPGVGGILLDPAQRTVTLAAGAEVDVGGIAKGLYADTLAGQLVRWPGGIVSAGGDLRVWGRSPEPNALWMIGLEDPFNPSHDLATIRVSSGGIATSGSNRRRWRRGVETMHHLIDPRTGLPARTGRASVTAVASTATEAEIISTALFIDGLSDDLIDRLAPAFSLAIVIEEDGSLRQVAGRNRSIEDSENVRVA